MPEIICDSKLCSGCTACIDICPKKCISKVLNEYCEIHPQINKEECIECGRCVRVCPQNNNFDSYQPQKCIAAYSKNRKETLDSASGGIAHEILKHFLDKEKTIAVGVGYDSQLHAEYKIAKGKEALNSFKGSKYVQSEMDHTIADVGDYLKRGYSVAFVGVSCVIAACLSYLNLQHINTKNLVTIELLCHGVVPQRYLDEQLQYICKKYHYDKVENLVFRSNRRFKDFHFSFTGIKADRRIYYNRYSWENPYFYGFLSGITLRESCYHCKFAEEKHNGDITLGDFIGLGQMPSSPSLSLPDGHPNVSLVLLNTSKGEYLWEEIQDNCFWIERPYQEAKEGCPALKGKTEKSIYREKFLILYKKTGFIQAMYDSCGKELKNNEMKLRPKRVVLSTLDKLMRSHQDN